MVRPGIIITIFFFLFLSCNTRKVEEFSGEPVTFLSGYFVHGEHSPVLIQKITSEQFITIDSAVLDANAEFESKIFIDYPGFYAVRNVAGNYITILCEGNDTVRIESDYSDFKHYELYGSDNLKEIVLLNKATQAFLDKIAIYAGIIRDSSHSPEYQEIWMETNAKYRDDFDSFKKFSENFIYRNEGSLISLLALSNQMGPDFYVFNPIQDRKIFQRVDSVLLMKYPDSELVKKNHAKLQLPGSGSSPEAGQIQTGKKAPDFSIPDLNSQILNFSDLNGKTVLLDFWASWSKSSRERNHELRDVYRKYHSRGFEILQISLDKNHEDWLEAISEDELSWLHGSELKFWDSEIALLYEVSKIPSNFLISPDGIIIAKNLPPSELDNKLEALLIP